jgi:hypothetical protein
MVYAVQNYKVYFGLYPSSGIYKTKKQNVSETGSVSDRWIESKIDLIVLYIKYLLQGFSHLTKKCSSVETSRRGYPWN